FPTVASASPSHGGAAHVLRRRYVREETESIAASDNALELTRFRKHRIPFWRKGSPPRRQLTSLRCNDSDTARANASHLSTAARRCSLAAAGVRSDSRERKRDEETPRLHCASAVLSLSGSLPHDPSALRPPGRHCRHHDGQP